MNHLCFSIIAYIQKDARNSTLWLLNTDSSKVYRSINFLIKTTCDCTHGDRKHHTEAIGCRFGRAIWKKVDHENVIGISTSSKTIRKVQRDHCGSADLWVPWVYPGEAGEVANLIKKFEGHGHLVNLERLAGETYFGAYQMWRPCKKTISIILPRGTQEITASLSKWFREAVRKMRMETGDS